MNGFDPQTLRDLEFDQVREWLSAYGIGNTAQRRLAALAPSNDFASVETALLRVAEFKSIRVEGESFPSLDFEELLPEIKLLPVRNAVLSQEGFVRIVRASDLVNSLLHFFDKRTQDFPHLCALLGDVYFTRELIDAIEKIFDRKGQVRDDASPELFRIRQQTTVLRNRSTATSRKKCASGSRKAGSAKRRKRSSTIAAC